jgi:hypothetical protein
LTRANTAKRSSERWQETSLTAAMDIVPSNECVQMPYPTTASFRLLLDMAIDNSAHRVAFHLRSDTSIAMSPTRLSLDFAWTELLTLDRH